MAFNSRRRYKNTRRKGKRSYFRKKKSPYSIITKKRKNVTPMVFFKSPGMIVPDRIMTKLRYSDTGYQINGAAGVAEVFAFRGNGPQDPQASAGGHQPMGYDQLTLLYGRYRVHSSKMNIKFLNNGSSNITSQAVVWVYPSNVTTYNSAVSANIEQPYCRWRATGNISNTDTITLTHNISTAKFLGYEDISQADELSAAQNATPALQWYWMFGGGSADNTNAIDVYAVPTIEYTVEFYDRISLNPS